jgi:uncharacterized alkaline shock family protein YloU
MNNLVDSPAGANLEKTRGSLTITLKAAESAVRGAIAQLRPAVQLESLSVNHSEQLIVSLSTRIDYPNEPISAVLSKLRTDLLKTVQSLLGPVAELNLTVSGFIVPKTRTSENGRCAVRGSP